LVIPIGPCPLLSACAQPRQRRLFWGRERRSSSSKQQTTNKLTAAAAAAAASSKQQSDGSVVGARVAARWPAVQQAKVCDKMDVCGFRVEPKTGVVGQGVDVTASCPFTHPKGHCETGAQTIFSLLITAHP